MGGVLARYALAEAEDSGDPLDVSHYVSLDSPHQGAAIDGELLSWIHDPPLFESKVKGMQDMLKTEAAKQMLVYNPYSSGEHDAFYQKLRTINGDGYPKKTQNIGVAFSDRWGTPDHGEWLAIEAAWLADIERFHISSGEDIAKAGSILPDEFTDQSWFIGAVDLERPKDPLLSRMPVRWTSFTALPGLTCPSSCLTSAGFTMIFLTNSRSRSFFSWASRQIHWLRT